MTTRNVIGVAILFLAIGFTIQSVQSNNAAAQLQASQQTGSSTSNAVSFQYARLVVDEGNDRVTWLVGGDERIRTESLARTFRRLGGNGSRIDLSNLLDQVGSLGWSLVQKEGNVWIFARRAS